MGVINTIVVAIFVFFGSELARADPPSGCEEIILPMCRGAVSYNYTRLGNNQTQAQIYALLEPTRRIMDNDTDTICSSLYRELACRIMVPKCSDNVQERPCRKDCKTIKNLCRGVFDSLDLSWPQELECRQLVKKPKKSRGRGRRRGGRRNRGRRNRNRGRNGRRRNRNRDTTVTPTVTPTVSATTAEGLEVGAVVALSGGSNIRTTQSPPVCKSMPKTFASVVDPDNPGAMYCQENEIGFCDGLPYTAGTLPNAFGQANVTQIANELSTYQSLVDSGCNDKLLLFLCSTFRPFCTDPAGFRYFVLPCRELCEEIHADCLASYNQLFPNWPWPTKFQCHTFWTSDSNMPCFSGTAEDDAHLLITPY